MKRTISWILVLSMILSLIPGIPLTASASTAGDPNYERRVTVRWGENGGFLWEVSYDHEQQLELIHTDQELPDGVRYETGRLTLCGAELFSIELCGWGMIPFRLEVLGENTIAALGDDNMALSIRHCHNMTIDGGGTLTMTAEDVTFQGYDTVAGTWSQQGGETTYENGLLTIRDVTIDAANLRPEGDFNEIDAWQWGAFSYMGNVSLENAILHIDGQYGLDVAGSLSIDGCTIDSTGFSISCREVQVNDGQSGDGFYPSVGTIRNSTLNIRDHHLSAPWTYHTMVLQPATELTLGEGAVITLDHSYRGESLSALIVNDDWQGTGRGGSMRIEGGSLTVRSDDPAHPAINVMGSQWTQTGGEVIVETALYDNCSVTVDRGSQWLQTGGTMSITNNHPMVSVEDGRQACALSFHRGSQAILSGGTLTTSGNVIQAIRSDSELILSGTTLHLDAYDTALDLYSRSRVHMLGGALEFTAQNLDNSFGIWAASGAGFTMTGGTMDLQCAMGFFSTNGLYRILGGETRIRGNWALNGGRERFTFSEGICIAYDDGTEALWEDDWCVPITDTVTIRHQTVRAPECFLLTDLVYPNSVVLGIPAPVELVAALTSPSGTVAVELPFGSRLDDSGVWINGRQAAHRLTETGFLVDVDNGAQITFQIIHGISGEQTLTARSEGREFPLTYNCAPYSFTVTPETLTSTIVLEGTAMPGARVDIYEASLGLMIQAVANELGTWRLSLRLPATGEYFFFAMLYDADGNYITVSDTQKVHYSYSATVLESLTIGNWIHGNTSESPNEYTEVVFDYLDLTASSGYYTYWPELPEFTFTAKFAGNSGTPLEICDVVVIGTDEYGNSESVALTYDPEARVWTGKGEFCGHNSIIPNQFQVQWKDATGAYGSTEEVYTDPRIIVDEDNTTGAVLILDSEDAGPFALELGSSGKVRAVTDGLGQQIPWTMEEDFCHFDVAQGGTYVVELSRGGFAQWPNERELTIFVRSAEPVRVVEYQPWVRPVSGHDLTDWTDTTFQSNARYSVGDVLLIDDADAVTVTGVSGDTYTYTPAGINELYRRLELSGFTGNEEITVTLGESVEELEARFRESQLYRDLMASLEEAAAELHETKSYEGSIGDTDFEISLTSELNENQAILKPEIVLSTTMKTKRPNRAEEETKVSVTISVEVLEDLTFQVVSEDKQVQSYLLICDETVTTELDIRVSVGDEEGSTGVELDGYFADKVRRNFLEKLRKEPAESPFELLRDARVSVAVYPGIFLYARPSVEISWNYFGEMYLTGTMVETGRRGISLVHLGDSFLGTWEDWSIRSFTDEAAQDRSFSASTGFHMSAFVHPALRLGVGLSVLKILDLEVWGKAGVKASFDGHGKITFATKKPVDVEAELLAELTLESSAGVGGYINLGKKRLTITGTEFELWTKSIPIKQFGFGLMPTEFALVEEDIVYVSSECDLKNLIDLRLDCQNFKAVGGIREEPRVLDRDRYTFELYSGSGVTVSPNGELKVHDPFSEFEFEVKVTYTGFAENYRLWKIVKMMYTPANITLTKRTPTGPASCTVLVLDITARPMTQQQVTIPGDIVIPAINGHTYHIVEITPPPKHTLDRGVRVVTLGDPDNPAVRPEGRAGFFNVPMEDPEPPAPFPIDPIGDPSGFVFEGIESNRLEGVTTTLYRADDESGTNARFWNAEDYDQKNPLTTDTEGKYLWMVPNGWWQVRYALEGYEAAETEWMIVPPVRTEVNQNLVTSLPAAASLYWNEQSGYAILNFSRPIQVSSLTDYTITLDGEEVWPHAEAVDADWSVTADPMDSVICATTFRLHFGTETDLREKTISFAGRNILTYYGTKMAELTASLTVPAATRHDVTVIGGSGSGSYEVGSQVTITAQPGLCQVFAYWASGNTRLEDPWSSTTRFRMPQGDVTVTAVYHWEHSYESQVTEPTCTEQGFTTHTCTHCGDSYTDTPTDMIDHTFGEWVLSVAPTYLESGMETRTCTHCGLPEHRLTDPLSNPFADVPAGSFYYEPVLWAAESGITNGTTATTFGPGDQCMRAHVVTFLWRAVGSPEPKSSSNPFADVKETDFYYKAVLWAVEKGITNGLDATHFGPRSYCNRAQVVTFLYRSLGSPQTDSRANPFTDVPDGQWFTAPVLWAVEKGITNGLTASTFGPNSICNRAQIVTFLYRAYA